MTWTRIAAAALAAAALVPRPTSPATPDPLSQAEREADAAEARLQAIERGGIPAEEPASSRGEVERLLEQAREAFGGELPPEIRYLSAKAIFQRRDLPADERIARARAAFEGVGAPWQLQAWYFQGVLEIQRENLPGALPWFERCAGGEAQDDRAREVRDLCRLALGRVQLEMGDPSAAIRWYRSVPWGSSHFTEALHELAWAHVRAGQLELALETASRDEIDALLSMHEDPVRYFNELIGRQDRALDVASVLPPLVVKWATSNGGVSAALGLVRALDDARREVQDARDLADRLDALLQRGSGLDAFPALQRGYSQAEAIENAAARAEGRCQRLERIQQLAAQKDVEVEQLGREYRFAHGMYYLLAYCLGEMGQGEEAQVAYQTLIERYPDSSFVPEAWVRLGDWHFDAVKADSLQNAARAFTHMYDFPAHPLFARAIYKLGWTYYRMDDFDHAVESFTRLLDHYVAEARKTGTTPGGDVWPEAIQYTAISFADEAALYNAASCYESARRFESALRLYERIPIEYPGADLADEALFRVGYNAENTYDFDKAVERYLALVENYPRSKHRKDALYNAARSLENLQSYDAAASAFARYATLHLDAEDAARTQFHAALLHEKMGDRRREIHALQEFVKRFSRSKEHELAAFYRKAFLLERLAHTISDAPVPPEFKNKGAEEYLAAYQDALAQAAQPYEDQAVGVYVQAIEAARKLHVKNEWTKKIGESLARHRPKEYPVLKEAKARLLAEDLSPSRFADTIEGTSRRPLPGEGGVTATATATEIPTATAPATATPTATPTPTPATTEERN